MPTFKRLNCKLREFIEKQHVFFVATAAPDGRVNVSPKGSDTLKIVDDTHVSWLNLTGSGNETAGHLRQLNRITMMFCAFEGNALILRLYGTAKTLHPRDSEWAAAIAEFSPMAGSRQIFDVEITSVQTSCGTGVPIMNYQGDRTDEELLPFYEEMGEDGVREYWERKNSTTIDGFDTGLFRD